MDNLKEANFQMIWQKKSLFLLFAFLFLQILAGGTGFPKEMKKSLLQLTIKGKKLRVEVARTEKEKERGLMFREGMGKDEGMLFVYEGENPLSFWMKNTRLPLSIAFIDKDGKIVDIQDMEPFSLQSYISAYPAKYALEVNRGWFKRNGIHLGDVVKIPSAIQKE